MTINYVLCAAFMLIVMLIIGRKAYSDIRQPKSRHICLWLMTVIAVYVIMDALFIVCFLMPLKASVFKVTAFIFYIEYVIVPFVWYEFMCNFVNFTQKKWIRKLEYIPLALMLAMVCYSLPTGTLYNISDAGEYTRGPWYNVFVIINLFYYVDTLVYALIMLLRKRNVREPYLLSSLLISCIPLAAVYMNSFVIPFGVVFPLQPFCLVLVGMLAYLFMADKETRIQQIKYQEELQSALEQAQTATESAVKASKVKTDFLSNMSHDIRTPLNAILGFSKIIEDNPADEKSVKNAIGKIQIAGNVLLSLVNDILDINRIENGKLYLEPVPTDLKALGNELEDMFSQGMQNAGINFVITTDIHTPFVMCDSCKLREIIVNLLGNAQKFTKAGGTVSLDIAEGERHSYRFTVKDTGIGISPEFQAHMFEAFERERTSTASNKTGTGLGLAIVKGLVELMDGKLEVESEQGKGTAITVIVSFVPSESIPESVKSVSAVGNSEDLKGIRILLAEDNELNREIADTLLEKLGATVTNAVNGAEAVKAFGSSPADTFDVILMDIMMPVMDGLTAAKTIRALDHTDSENIPIFAMTANAFAEDIRKSHDAGMNEHLSKPLDMDELVGMIRRYI